MHYLDPVQYILGKDDTSPVEVWADGPQQHPDACGTWRRIEMKYADGCTIVLDGEDRDKNAPFLEGPQGKIFRGFRSDIPHFEEKVAALPDPEPQITDFAESVRTRRRFALNERNGHRSCTIVNLGKIAVQLGRTLRFDPEKERFVGDDEANRLVDQPTAGPLAPAGVMLIPENDDETGTGCGPHPLPVLWLALRRPSTLEGGSPADLEGRVSAILARFPAQAPPQTGALCAEILALGPEAVADVCARVRPPGKGDDARARFAVNGLAVHVMRPRAETERALFVRVLLDALGRTKDEPVAVFFLSQLRLVGKQESIRPLERYLVDETLAGPAAGVLVSIGGPQATRALLAALDKAPPKARLALVEALGEARSREAVKKILPLADSADEGLRQAALFALANIGDPVAGPALSRSRVPAAYQERSAAPSLYLLYARRLRRVRPDDRRAECGPRGPRELPSTRGVAARVGGPRPRRLGRRGPGPA